MAVPVVMACASVPTGSGIFFSRTFFFFAFYPLQSNLNTTTHAPCWVWLSRRHEWVGVRQGCSTDTCKM